MLTFKNLLEKSRTAPLKPQKWGNTGRSKSTDVRDVYDQAQQKASTLKPKFEKKLKSVTRSVRNPKILTDVKGFASFASKVGARNKKASAITDVLRGAILVQTEDDVKRVVNQIKKDMLVVEYEQKKKGGDKEFGYYGSHHFLVDMDGMASEIQVMTKRLWTYKEKGHEIYNQFRDKQSGGVDDKEKKTKRQSKQIFSRGNQTTDYYKKKK